MLVNSRTATAGRAARRFPGIVLSVSMMLVVSACAGPAVGTGAATQSTAASATPTPTTTAVDGTRIIGFDRIGDLAVGMTVEEIGRGLGSPLQSDTQSPGCVFYYAGGGPADDDDPLITFFGVQAATEGPDARVEVLGFGVPLKDTDAPDGLPRTAEGIGVGSTAEDVRAAYPTGLVERPSKANEGFTVLRLSGPGGTGIAFQADEQDVVEQISVGRLAHQDGCEGKTAT